MAREFYSDDIANFIVTSPATILGMLADSSPFSDEVNQKESWKYQILLLQQILRNYQGYIYFEYSIPRMGQRIDVLLLIGPVVFVIEFKVGEHGFQRHSIDQVWDYALDLKNFHETSHHLFVAPVLVATEAHHVRLDLALTPQNDNLLFPILSNEESLSGAIKSTLNFVQGEPIDPQAWGQGRYCPTPTIVEAASALFGGHHVDEIARSEAGENLSTTSGSINRIINDSRCANRKSICFVTGVPGAGKTLVGLNIATANRDESSKTHSVFLSGNGPLVAILREALARDAVSRAKREGIKKTKSSVSGPIKSFIQNVHHFRDEALESDAAPVDHVVLFDEAQRAWDLEQTRKFMKQRKGKADFNKSEPEFLISYLDRHDDWAVVVCLVGGGQEINTGEAGISEWLHALNRSFPDWQIYVSKQIHDDEYAAGGALSIIKQHRDVNYIDELHLSVSMRSFRAENVSNLVKEILDMELDAAKRSFAAMQHKYPIVITRCLHKAKRWVKQQARGTERYGLVVSSQAARLKPHAIDVRSPIDPVHWFLDGKDDVRSSYYLEDVATEFQIQGLELDWACVTWDADFRYSPDGWSHHSFRGSRWNKIKKDERKLYLKNAYRVLLTRARQGMVIVVPEGDHEDATRSPKYYDTTFEYLSSIGFSVL